MPVVRPQSFAILNTRFIYPLLALWIALGLVAMVGGWGLIGEVLGAVNEGSAVSALGWDYLLAVAGAGIWAWRVGGIVGEEGKMN